MIPISDDLHQRLVAWARWVRGSVRGPALPTCLSAEHGYLPPAGEVWTSVEDLLVKQVRRAQAPFNEHEAMQVELRIMRLPERPKTALRLHYVVYKAMPMQRKCRILGCTGEEYPVIVGRAALLIDARPIRC